MANNCLASKFLDRKQCKTLCTSILRISGVGFLFSAMCIYWCAHCRVTYFNLRLAYKIKFLINLPHSVQLKQVNNIKSSYATSLNKCSGIGSPRM